MKTTLFLACAAVALLGITLWPATSPPRLAAGDAKGKQGVELPEDPLLAAIQKRLGKPDRVSGSGRMFHYDLPNGDTLTLAVSGRQVLGAGSNKDLHNGDLSDAIRTRLGEPNRVTGSGRAFLHYDLPNGDSITFVVSAGKVLGAYHTTPDVAQANDPIDAIVPREVAAGMFEKWQKAGAKNLSKIKYTRVEYDKKTFWVVDVHHGYGNAYKTIAVYAPEKDGAFRRCLLADSNAAGNLAVTVDAKTGMLELREKANSNIKGEVVLSCNLKTIGTPASTGVVP